MLQNRFSVSGGVCAILALSLLPGAWAQGQYGDRDHDRMTRLEPGMTIPVRTVDMINSDRSDNRVYMGRVDQDIRGENGRLAIPRGARVELMVRVAPDNDLTLDLESITVDGQRCGVRAEPNHIESQKDRGVVGAIEGAINGGQVRGREVHVPRDTVITFRLDRPLEMGVADRGVDRDGYHYHDYERDEH